MTRDPAANSPDQPRHRNLRVVKLGGSLLSLDDWPQRFADWIASEVPARTVLIVGGGKLADCVREYDRRFALGEEASHWLCIRALSLHAEMAAQLLPRTRLPAHLVRNFDALSQVEVGSLAVFDPEPFLREIESSLPGEPLPHTWNATTDSIAARVAECLDADELVLLKSNRPPTLDVADYVDEQFGRSVQNVRSVRFVDLRNSDRRSEAML
jgi:aspartokinase-like uncharacterized kinase